MIDDLSARPLGRLAGEGDPLDGAIPHPPPGRPGVLPRRLRGGAGEQHHPAGRKVHHICRIVSESQYCMAHLLPLVPRHLLTFPSAGAVTRISTA